MISLKYSSKGALFNEENRNFFKSESAKIFDRRRHTRIEVPFDKSIYYPYETTKNGLKTCTGTKNGLTKLKELGYASKGFVFLADWVE